MTVLDTKHKKKSFVITLILHILLLLLLFFIGLHIQDDEPEGGIAVNFGTTITGSGDQQPTAPIKATPKQTTPEVTQPPPEEVQEEVREVNDQVVTQEIEDAPVIEKKQEKKTKKKLEKPKEKPQKTTPVERQLEQKKIDKPVKKVEEKKPDPKPDKATSDALDSFLNGPKSDGKASGGEGDDTTSGDKGDPNGDPDAKSYYGNGKGLDGDGNYRLGGRKALNKEKFVQECNESGIVVVKIEVDQSGKVIKATPGVKGTTNNTACLMNPANRAALATRFNSDPKAPAKQVGTIRYQFKLSE